MPKNKRKILFANRCSLLLPFSSKLGSLEMNRRQETAPSKLYYNRCSLKGCINGTRATFVPAQVHPGFLSRLCIRLSDTAQKIHTSRTQRNSDKVLRWCSLGSLLARNAPGILERPLNPMKQLVAGLRNYQ